MKTIYYFIISSAILLLSACGQSGVLYLPTPTARAEHPHDTFILGDSETKKQQDAGSNNKQKNP